MPRPRKPSVKQQSTNRLLEALNFLSSVTTEVGTPYQTHILLQNKTAVAYNDILSAGCLIDEEIFAAPHNSTLIKAISKCIESYSLVIDGTKIVCKSGKFKASIPCIDPSLLSFRFPDNPCAVIDDSFKEALKCMDVLKIEPNAQETHLLAFLLNGQSTINTNGKLLIEYWHGINLPTIAIPKAIIAPILNNKKKLTQFGFSQTSVTFYFEDNSWIKSQLYDKPYPVENVLRIMDKNCNPIPIPTDFFKALSTVEPFSENNSVYFERDLLCSHSTPETGATHEVAGLPKGPVYNAKYLSMIKDYVTQIDFVVPERNGYLCYFFGKQVRGVIAGYG